MKKKLIKGGGSSFCEATKNMENAGLEVVPSRDKCMYVLSNASHINDGTLSEDDSDEFSKWLFNAPSGGTITFSTDVNSKTLADNGVKNWLLQKFTTVKNRVLYGKILDRIRKKNGVYAWTVGRYLRGVYTGENGKTFNENSITIDVLGVDRKTLFALAEEIKNVFAQESVLVEDRSTKQFYFVS